MTDDMSDLEDLARSIRKIISDNEQFLSAMMEDDFDAEDEETGTGPPNEL